MSKDWVNVICNIQNRLFCDDFIKFFTHIDPEIFYHERFAIFYSNMPSGAGYKSFLHYGQLVEADSNYFRRYDFGYYKNLKLYGQDTPPAFDLSNINFPVAIFSGSQDNFANAKDVIWLSHQLSYNLLFHKEYNQSHMSFVLAKDMSWFRKDAMAVLNYSNGKCDAYTGDSNFETGNYECKGVNTN